MSRLRISNRTGDEPTSWSAAAVDRGDPDVRAAVREAERILARERRRDAFAFRVLPCALALRIYALVDWLLLERSKVEYWRAANQFIQCTAHRSLGGPQVTVWTGRAPGVLGQR